jgi:cytochrome c peroxidase
MLGRTLFWDETISLNGKVSCGSCHPVAAWGADSVADSTDARGEPSGRHTPTVFNASLQPTLRWLGDRNSSAQQAEGSLTGSLGFPSLDAALVRLRERGYEPLFRAAFPDDPTPLTTRNYGAAIGAYEGTLLTPAPFDRFLEGDDAALTAEQLAGLRAFMDIGCSSCHRGPVLGGTQYQKFGITRDYWELTGSTKLDPGRFSVTRDEDDRYVFRVPMLRNITQTAPYFHDGSVDQLGRAVTIMADLQLGVRLNDATRRSIVAFLSALTGPVPATYAPPPSGTPRP